MVSKNRRLKRKSGAIKSNAFIRNLRNILLVILLPVNIQWLDLSLKKKA
jgi:hypothetical protein